MLALNVAAAHLGWWSFDARGGLLLGVPVDLYLVWVCLWGLVAALAFPSLSMLRLLLLALVIDLVLMPAASPVVALGPSWLAGETAGLLFGLLPGQMLARWTARDEYAPSNSLPVDSIAGGRVGGGAAAHRHAARSH